MHENPYRSPVETREPPVARPPLSTRFVVGLVLLPPACWLLGRGLIPPDDVALRFSVVTWIVLSIVWWLVVPRRRIAPR